jgi:hypothetical protein
MWSGLLFVRCIYNQRTIGADTLKCFKVTMPRITEAAVPVSDHTAPLCKLGLISALAAQRFGAFSFHWPAPPNVWHSRPLFPVRPNIDTLGISEIEDVLEWPAPAPGVSAYRASTPGTSTTRHSLGHGRRWFGCTESWPILQTMTTL